MPWREKYNPMSEIENARKLFFEAVEFIDFGDFPKAELRLRDALYYTPP